MDDEQVTGRVGIATPSGRLVRLADHLELQLSRTFRAGIDDVWTSVTESDRTARWIGPWTGRGAAGETITVTFLFEEGEPDTDMHIDVCEAPRRLAVSTVDDHGAWRIELRLAEVVGGTEIQLVHLLETADGIGEVGPGWEYYLDLLAAAIDDHDQPRFEDYYPAQKAYFEGLQPD